MLATRRWAAEVEGEEIYGLAGNKAEAGKSEEERRRGSSVIRLERPYMILCGGSRRSGKGS